MSERRKVAWLPWAEFPINITHGDAEEALAGQLFSWAVENGRTVHRVGWSNETVEPAARLAIIAKVDEAWAARGGRRLMQAEPLLAVWAGPDGVMWWGGNTFEMSSFDPSFVEELREKFELLEPAEGAQPTVYLLERGDAGPFFNEMKVPISPFIPTNYSPKVAEQYSAVLDGLVSSDPAGRLVLLSGDPGTGKSHFVRGLLEDARKKALFCLVPPHMITALDGPDFVGSLRELREPARHVPRRRRRMHLDEESPMADKAIVLVLEDADACLVPRQMDNISTIAALLNMSDGIFGAALDLRIIATTNAASFEIDPAISRPGRLLAHVMFDELNVEQSNKVLARLGSSERILPSANRPIKTTLAKLYAMARKGVV